MCWDDRGGRPSTLKTEANIEKVFEIFRQIVPECSRICLVNKDKETVRQILHNNFNMKKGV
jgi:hypothetical protein